MTDPVSAYLQSRSSDKAASAQKEAAGAGIDTQWKMYEQTRADQMPWLKQGMTSLEQLGSMMGKDGSLLRPFSMKDYQKTPNYDFVRGEGIRGIENSMAGRSGFGGGNMLKALARYNSGLASNEFQNSRNNYNEDNTNMFNRLAALAGTGQTTAANLGSVGQNTANQVAAGQSDYGDAAARRYMGRAGVYKGMDEDLTQAAGIVLGSKFK